MSEGVVQEIRPCDTCKLPVIPTDWFIFCTKHLIREHVECAYSSLTRTKHRKCKRIDKNRGEKGGEI
jgi:hypothetical protein